MRKNKVFLMLGLAFFMTVGGILLSKNVSNSGIKASESIKLETNKETTTIGETFQLALKEPEILKTDGEEETAVEEKKATIIPLPEGLRFDEQRTNQANDAQVNYSINWNEEKRQIEVMWLTQQNLNEVQLVVTGVTEGVYDIEASRLVGGMEEVSNKIVLSVTTPKATEENPIIRTPRIGNLNMDVDISPVTTSIASGTDAIYKLNFKTTGAMIQYKNTLLVVGLPTEADFTQDLSELIIAGVQPEYDAVTHSLTYRFPELVTGQAYQVNIKVLPPNGTTPSGTKLTTKATLSADNFSAVTDTADVNVTASLPFSVTKSYVGVEGRNAVEGPMPGDTVIWKVRATVSSNQSGLLFLKNNQKIVISDTLIDDLTYVGTTSTIIPTKSGQTIKWTFDGPTVETQQQAVAKSENLWSTEFLVKTKAATPLKVTTLTNQVSLEMSDFGGQVIDTLSNKASIGIATGGNPVETPNGSWFYPTYLGPQGGYVLGGGYSMPSSSFPNPMPTVLDTAILYFGTSYFIAPYKEGVYKDKDKKSVYPWSNPEVYTKGYSYVSVHEEIDSNLVLEILSVAKPMNRARIEDTTIPLSKMPNATVNLEVNTKGNWKSMHISSEELESLAFNSKAFTRKMLNLNSTDKVLSYGVMYKNSDGSPIDGGFSTLGFASSIYSIKDGYVGKVTNRTWLTGQVVGASTPFYRFPLNDDEATPLGPRSANVVKPSTSIPIVSTTVSLSSQNGQIEPGDNKVLIKVHNNGASQARLKTPIHAMLLLPEGVKLKSNPLATYYMKTTNRRETTGGSYVVVAGNYNNTNRQLIKVNWDTAELPPSYYGGVEAELSVDISETAPSPLIPIVYGFSGNQEFSVPTATGTNVTNSILEIDSDDLNGNGNKTQNRVKSMNSYVMLRDTNVKTEKSVKGSEDSNFSKFGHTVPGGEIEYKLNLTNTTDEPLTSFTLMDVLPSVGDLGITDGVNRESTFATKMTGPIQVPSEWENKITVSYSTATNPKRDDLVKNVDYPGTTQKIVNPASATSPNWVSAGAVTDWSKIHSFKIELSSNVTWVKGQNISLNFTMQAPSYEEIEDKNILDSSVDEKSRAAWNSFAYAANRLQVVEPERVGVVMNELGKVRIQKVDSEDKNQTLEGASFVIAESEAQLKNGKTIKLDGNGKLVYPSDDNYSDSMKDYQLTSTNKGILEFDKLRLGGVDGDTYYLKEVEAPKGYQLLTTYVKVTAAPEDSLVLIQVMNTKKVVMPQTGSMRIVLFIVLGLGLVGTGIVYYINKQGERVVGEAKRKK